MSVEPPLPDGEPDRPPEAGRAVSVQMPLGRVWATYVVMGLIAVVFAAQLALEQLTGVDLVLLLGAKINEAIAAGQIWRLLTAVFIHAGLVHFLFNMYALYYLGQQVEAFFGWLRFTIIFLFSGLAGSTLSLLFNANPSVGASGGVFGLIAALGVFLYRNRALFGQQGRHQLQNIVVIAAINLLIGLQGGIDNWGHLGGLLGGLVLGWLIGPVWQVEWDPMQGGRPVVRDTQVLAGRVPLLLALLAGFAAFISAAVYYTVLRYR